MKTRIQHALAAAWVAAACAFTPLLYGASAASPLEAGFQRPPPEARPWVYWFWLNSNITSNGITADLEAMARVGIGGVLIMEVDQGAPVGPVAFMSPGWRDLFRHAVVECQRLGLELNMNNDAGWNGSGGPWIRPEQSMQKIVWTETQLEGPRLFREVLPQAAAVAGYYRDIAVLAFPSSGDFRLENIRAKAAFDVGHVGGSAAIAAPVESVINLDQMTNLTARMDHTGRLSWDVPAGRWTVLRFGHTSTGVENAPAPTSGRGLECDKLSREGIEANFAGMMRRLLDDAKPNDRKAFVATHIDSWENGSQNWTARMREEFQKRRGYDLLPFLPATTGRVVGSGEIAERFLWDLRQTVSDLVIENYAGHLRTLAAGYGLKLTIEAYGGPCDDLPYAGRADEPMCEFWMGGGAFHTIKEMASAAHTYGKNILGAEAFTADDREKWLEHPGSIKALGDRAFCDGVNRMVFHRYALQPWSTDPRPGMTMGPWGLHYERSQTWWEWSRPWHEYLARCQFLLRAGRFTADLCYLQPETAPQGLHSHARPKGYDYDNCSAEVVLTRMSVRDGLLVLPDGMSYQILVLPDTATMTPALLRKIKALVQAGATVLGPRPSKSPSLADYPRCDEEVAGLAKELWADINGSSVTEHPLGKGRVISGVPVEKVLVQKGVLPDFSSRARLSYIHRTTEAADIYFVANPQPFAIETMATFRVTDQAPQFWRPDTGSIEAAPVFEKKPGGTSVRLALEGNGSVFVVFPRSVPAGDAVVDVRREGESLLPNDRATPRLLVRKAVYGVLNDPARTRDVAVKVQRLADSGELSFRVASLAEGDDPAFGVVKTVEIEYAVNDQPRRVTAKDPDSVFLSDDPAQIVIDKAVYGVLDDPKRTREVRAKVQEIVDAGERSFEVARLARGDDPAYLVVKTAAITYTINGQQLTVSGTDPDTIYLAPPPVAVVSVAEVMHNDRGQTRLRAAQAGRYELKFASGQNRQVEVRSVPAPVEIAGPWSVSFDAAWGGPVQPVTFATLSDWSKRPEDSIRFYSGTATYQCAFQGPEHAASETILDLGKVAVMAEVRLNGESLGVLWKPPFKVDVSRLIRRGENKIEVKVVNLWINRMIGDENLDEDSARNSNGTLKKWPEWLERGRKSPAGRYTFSSWRLWKKDAPLQPSGLLGPVTLRSYEHVEVR